MADLTEQETAVLDLAGTHWKYPAARETEMYRLFGFGENRYFQVLNHLLRHHPQAEARYPQLVRRLRRLQDLRRSHRTHRPRMDL